MTQIEGDGGSTTCSSTTADDSSTALLSKRQWLRNLEKEWLQEDVHHMRRIDLRVYLAPEKRASPHERLQRRAALHSSFVRRRATTEGSALSSVRSELRCEKVHYPQLGAEMKRRGRRDRTDITKALAKASQSQKLTRPHTAPLRPVATCVSPKGVSVPFERSATARRKRESFNRKFDKIQENIYKQHLYTAEFIAEQKLKAVQQMRTRSATVKSRREALRKAQAEAPAIRQREEALRRKLQTEINSKRQKVHDWTKMVALIAPTAHMATKLYHTRLSLKNMMRRQAAASFIAHSWRSYYVRKLAPRLRALLKRARALKSLVRRRRKRLAMRLVAKFLRDFAESNGAGACGGSCRKGKLSSPAIVIRTFMKRVSTAQQIARDFIACRQVRLQTSLLYCRKLEADIRHDLERKAALKASQKVPESAKVRSTFATDWCERTNAATIVYSQKPRDIQESVFLPRQSTKHKVQRRCAEIAYARADALESLVIVQTSQHRAAASQKIRPAAFPNVDAVAKRVTEVAAWPLLVTLSETALQNLAAGILKKARLDHRAHIEAERARIRDCRVLISQARDLIHGAQDIIPIVADPIKRAKSQVRFGPLLLFSHSDWKLCLRRLVEEDLETQRRSRIFPEQTKVDISPAATKDPDDKESLETLSATIDTDKLDDEKEEGLQQQRKIRISPTAIVGGGDHRKAVVERVAHEIINHMGTIK